MSASSWKKCISGGTDFDLVPDVFVIEAENDASSTAAFSDTISNSTASSADLSSSSDGRQDSMLQVPSWKVRRASGGCNRNGDSNHIRRRRAVSLDVADLFGGTEGGGSIGCVFGGGRRASRSPVPPDDDVPAPSVNTAAAAAARGLPVITLEELAENESWISIYDKVYDMTDYFDLHPGGFDVLMENGGRDASMQFLSVGHSKEAIKVMEKYLIGVLPEEDWMWGDIAEATASI